MEDGIFQDEIIPTVVVHEKPRYDTEFLPMPCEETELKILHKAIDWSKRLIMDNQCAKQWLNQDLIIEYRENNQEGWYQLKSVVTPMTMMDMIEMPSTEYIEVERNTAFLSIRHIEINDDIQAETETLVIPKEQRKAIVIPNLIVEKEVEEVRKAIATPVTKPAPTEEEMESAMRIVAERQRVASLAGVSIEKLERVEKLVIALASRANDQSDDVTDEEKVILLNENKREVASMAAWYIEEKGQREAQRYLLNIFDACNI